MEKGQRYIENYSNTANVDYDSLLNIDVKITDSYLDDLLKRMMITYPDMFVEPIV